MYVVRHHKARRSTNQEFYVARYLPFRACRPLFYYLVYIRPTVEALLRRCFQDHSTSTLLFCTNPIVARQPFYRHWETRDLNQALRDSNHNYLEFCPRVRLCRQLTIAMTEKHVRGAMQFDQYDDRSQRASINTVLAWQSGHRPVQRATNYGLDSAFPHLLQPSLLRLYEHVSNCWHQFLGLEYTNVDSQKSLKSLQCPVEDVAVSISRCEKRRPLLELQ